MADLYNSQGGKINAVTVKPLVTSGTKIAEINGTGIYAPNSGGGGGGGTPTPTQDIKVQIPDKVFAVVGTELNIWNDTITLSMDRGLESPINYYVEWSCDIGKMLKRGFRLNPVAADVGTHSCTCYIYDMNGVQLDNKTFQIIVLAKTANIVKNVLFVGDSTGTSTYDAVQANFADSNRFSGVAPTIHNQSKGGWHWGVYANAGSLNYRVQVSNIGTLGVGAQYTDGNNNLFEILEVNTTGGTGNVLIGKLYKPPYGYNPLTLPSGTLTKRKGTGDSTLSYTGGVEEEANPFWNTAEGKLDIGMYRANNNIADPFDMVIFQLGINSHSRVQNAGWLEGCVLDLYDAFMEDNPNCMFVLGCTPICTNDPYAIGAVYGAVTTWGLSYGQDEYRIREIYFDLAYSGEYPNIKVIGENLSIDRWYGYPMAEQDISDRVSDDEVVHTNYVHPAASGYAQLGDAVFASIIGLFS